PRQPTVEELGWGNSPFPIPAFSLQPFAFSLFLIDNRNLCRDVAVLRLNISIHTRIQQLPNFRLYNERYISA
ncbi:MAG: hypothetical protein AAGG00_14205, partial [Cyanobacteria bacterium P01_H01_bin.150]